MQHTEWFELSNRHLFCLLWFYVYLPVELNLYLAKVLKQNVCKLEVDINYDKGSSTIKIKDIIIMLIEILKIRFNKNYFKK